MDRVVVVWCSGAVDRDGDWVRDCDGDPVAAGEDGDAAERREGGI